MSDNTRIVLCFLIILTGVLAIFWFAGIEEMAKAGRCGSPIRIEVCAKEGQ